MALDGCAAGFYNMDSDLTCVCAYKCSRYAVLAHSERHELLPAFLEILSDAVFETGIEGPTSRGIGVLAMTGDDWPRSSKLDPLSSFTAAAIGATSSM